ncbi:glycosyltransferase [Shewanella sp. CAL98-MNA-CIBAN-0140]|uniref:glycosyltransferase family 2 protein n=1 Tax=Shewanella sp. CAL98-MNA-CIBAN-0140 TaxID=3140462 RepID=UPI00331BC06A
MYISLILPVYNAELYLDEAINSLLKQTHSKFELICIDDGSTDNSLPILTRFEQKDSRIVLLSRNNRGLIYTLNEAIGLAKYRYIARMDADDICEPDRLQLQLAEMQLKKLAILGSSYQFIDEDSSKLGVRNLPSSDRFIKYLMDFGSPLCHPSVLFDKQVLGDNLYYNSDFKHCEDYELWLRCRQLGFRFGNLKEIAFNYRILNTSVSRVHSEAQKQSSISLITKYCSYVRTAAEAEYLLYSRKQNKKMWTIAKFCSRILLEFNLVKFFFVIIYLLK